MSDNFLQSRSVKVDQIKLRRKVLYCFAIFAIINEKLIKEAQPICASMSARRKRLSHCNLILSARRSGGQNLFTKRNAETPRAAIMFWRASPTASSRA